MLTTTTARAETPQPPHSDPASLAARRTPPPARTGPHVPPPLPPPDRVRRQRRPLHEGHHRPAPDLLATALAFLDCAGRCGRRRRRNDADDGPDRRADRAERRRVPRDRRRAVQEHGQRRRGNLSRHGQPDDAVSSLRFGSSSRRRIWRGRTESEFGGRATLDRRRQRRRRRTRPTRHPRAGDALVQALARLPGLDRLYLSDVPHVGQQGDHDLCPARVRLYPDAGGAATEETRVDGTGQVVGRHLPRDPEGEAWRVPGHGHGADQGGSCRLSKFLRSRLPVQPTDSRLCDHSPGRQCLSSRTSIEFPTPRYPRT